MIQSHRPPGPSRSLSLLILLGLALASLAGCANNGITPELTAGRLDNPSDGIPVRLGEIRDLRRFQNSPSRTFVPSLQGDLEDFALRSRAVGRATNEARRPAENIVLDPPLTVESLVGEAAARALREAGYRVLGPGSFGYDEAIELELEINRLWMMQNLPPMPPHARVDIQIRIVGALFGFERGIDVEAYRKVSGGGMNRGLFRQALERGLDEWSENAQGELERTRSAVERAAALQ